MRTILAIAATLAAAILPVHVGHAQVQPATLQQGQGQWRTLSGPELQNVLLTYRVGTLNRFNAPFLNMFTSDGRVYGQAQAADVGPTQGRTNPYAMASDTGTYKIQGSNVCVTMQNWLQGQENCWGLETNGTHYRFVGAGALNGKYAHFNVVPWQGGSWVWQNTGGG